MKNILTLAAGLALTSTALAAPEGSSWLELDSEIAQLSSTTVEEGGAHITGFMRMYFNSDSDNDVQGWSFEHLRLEANGKVEGYKYRLSTEMKSSTAKLADAWVYWKLTDDVMARMGNFKQPFLSTFGYLRGSHRLLPMVTNSANHGKREAGLALNGKLLDKQLGWWAGAMNGIDGAGEDLSFYGRVAYDFGEKSAFSKFEGAVDAPEDGFNVSASVAFNDDQNDTSGGQRMALEVMAEGNGLYLHGELVDYDDEFVGNDKLLSKVGAPVALMDTSPMALTGSYMIADDMELALRYEDFDDANDSNRMTLGFNWYQVLPHTVKWQVAYSDVGSDNAAVEAQVVTLGMVIGF